MNPEIEQLKTQIADLSARLAEIEQPGGYRIRKDILIGTLKTKVGFFASPPIGQYTANATPANVDLMILGIGDTVTHDASFNGKGASGGTFYTIGDIVRALKNIGILKE